MIGKAEFMKFSLIEAANHVLRVGDQWKKRADQAGVTSQTTNTPERHEYPSLRKFTYPVQKLMVDQWKLAAKNLSEDDEPAGDVMEQMRKGQRQG